MDALDPELQAMSDIAQAIAKLDGEESRIRVLRWVAEKYTPSVVSSALGAPAAKQLPGDADNADEDTPKPDFEVFADLYDAVNPSTNVERVLTGAYWLQVIQNVTAWRSYDVNKLLKDTGYGVESIARTFSDAQDRKPALVRQLSKSGKSRQAKKTYKLTTAGVEFIAARAVSRD